MDLGLYDLMMNWKPVPPGKNDIVLVEIDDHAIERIGPWPWSRALIARGLEKIGLDHPKAVGLDFVFEMPEINTALNELEGLEELFKKSFSEEKGVKETAFLESINRAKNKLEGDRKLAAVIQQSNTVILPILLRPSDPLELTGKSTTIPRSEHALKNIRKDRLLETRTDRASFPQAAFLGASKGIGVRSENKDDIRRREMILYSYKEMVLPSYALALAIQYLGIPRDQIEDSETGLRLAEFQVPTDRSAEMLINFKGPRGSFQKYSFVDVLERKVPDGIFKDKIVLISLSSPMDIHSVQTPMGSMLEGELTANVLWTITQKQFIEQPRWGIYAEALAIVVIGGVIAFLLPGLGTPIAGIVCVILLFVIWGGSFWMFSSKGLFIATTCPFFQLILGYMGVVVLKRYQPETAGRKTTQDSPETSRLLAETFHREGMLDMAFDKLQRIPADEDAKKLLYDIALDYEKKSQFPKAVSVYEYIEEHDPEYRDIQLRKRNLVKAGETIVLGDKSAGSGLSDTSSLPLHGDRLQMLGRYEIIKEIGRGAMGRVYLGKDPRINRTTAIKTFRFSDDFEPEEIQKMKDMFFREAESAGTLSHANIVTIYDAGEEEGLAYIAMEYLDGVNLEKFIKKGDLLPIRKAIDYLFHVADALDYAHQKGIVHRDIKPANIMLLKNGTLKITDFGIARISSTSQTQTGVVKGTPFYMSPEQFSGERVDGRSDIFSLGVMMFQLLTGSLPFSSRTPIELMRKIMKEPHPDPKTLNPKIIAPLVKIMDKALEKDRKKRYQRASQMAIHLLEIGKRIDAAVAEWKAKQKESA